MNRTESIPTLLVNRQLRDETLAAIDILPSKYTYDLDILLVDGKFLYPTWLSIPALTNVVDRLHTSIRIDLTAARQYQGFRLGCGGPPILVWSFLAILNRFLSVGPIGHPGYVNVLFHLEHLGARLLIHISRAISRAPKKAA